jgi:protease YdgD
MGRTACGAALALWIATLPALAEEALPPSWPAVGRISYGEPYDGAAICTGILVAPDLVMTAGHCLRPEGEGEIPPGTILFAAGLVNDEPVAERWGVEAIFSGMEGARGDVALLRLEAPVSEVESLPLARMLGFDVGGMVTVGYRRDTPESPEVQQDCALLGNDDGLLGLDCDMVSGNSGAPALVWRDGAWSVAGVVVAKMRGAGPVRSVAVRPDAALVERIFDR